MEDEKKQVVSVCVKIPTTKMGSVKVTSMVGTFLNEYSIGRLFKGAIGYSYEQVF